uniref:Focal AT domain-containing protein n=1 Tax=Timema cristinae TaxID=61476 RepID=A0A7R9CWH3_TIMCR|nr:unnamed protein product [Timema cristinae]
MKHFAKKGNGLPRGTQAKKGGKPLSWSKLVARGPFDGPTPNGAQFVEMAHKVLSKDMGELVNALKLAQKYTPTTLDAEYRKGMLSAAHILAMDAKNLLDVIDSIRIRYSEVNDFICTVIHPVVQDHCDDEDVQNQRFQEDPKSSVQDMNVVGSLEHHKKTSQSVIPPQPQYSVTKKLPLVAASRSTSPPSQAEDSAPAPVPLDS